MAAIVDLVANVKQILVSISIASVSYRCRIGIVSVSYRYRIGIGVVSYRIVSYRIVSYHIVRVPFCSCLFSCLFSSIFLSVGHWVDIAVCSSCYLPCSVAE